MCVRELVFAFQHVILTLICFLIDHSDGDDQYFKPGLMDPAQSPSTCAVLLRNAAPLLSVSVLLLMCFHLKQKNSTGKRFRLLFSSLSVCPSSLSVSSCAAESILVFKFSSSREPTRLVFRRLESLLCSA